MLYLGFDVRDGVVQYHPDFDRWDGFLVTINDRAERHTDNNLLRPPAVVPGRPGRRRRAPGLPAARWSRRATPQVAIALKPGTTVDTLGVAAWTTATPPSWRSICTALGYPADLGDGALFFGVTLLDGDSFTPFTDSYGTRTWWFREYEGECCAAWAYLAPGAVGVTRTIRWTGPPTPSCATACQPVAATRASASRCRSAQPGRPSRSSTCAAGWWSGATWACSTRASARSRCSLTQRGRRRRLPVPPAAGRSRRPARVRATLQGKTTVVR